MTDQTLNFIIGDRVSLRMHVESDLVEWASWFNSSEVTTYMEQGYFPNTVPAQRERLAKLYDSKEHLQLAVIDKQSGELCGTVGLHHINFINQNSELSIVVGNKKYWGKGYGREAVFLMIKHAFEKLNLRKITAGMVVGNQASHDLFSSLGFVVEGEFKEHLFIQGRFQNMYKLSLFR